MDAAWGEFLASRKTESPESLAKEGWLPAVEVAAKLGVSSRHVDGIAGLEKKLVRVVTSSGLRKLRFFRPAV